MRKLTVLVFIFTSQAYCDILMVDYWNHMAGPAPYDVDRDQYYSFENVDTVALKEQELDITFTFPDIVSVTSDYVFDVLEADQKMYLGFFPDRFVPFEKNPFKRIYFKVVKDGEEVEQDLITWVPKKDHVVFPVYFDREGESAIRIEYSYKLKKGFKKLYNREDETGFCYTFEPARFWAGTVSRIRVRFNLEGGDIRDLSSIKPDDFSFTDSGCEWVWDNVSDNDLFFIETQICYGGRYGLASTFATVQTKSGVEIHEGKGVDSPVLATLKKGDRLYLLGGVWDGRADEDGFVWVRCRLLDNRIGWVPYYLDGKETFRRKR